MEKQKIKKLQAKHKTFFKLRNNKDFPISSGIECDDGWYDLIDKTILKVLELCVKYKVKTSIQITQIKEKLGELKIHFNSKPENKEVIDLIQCVSLNTALKSTKICEICSRKAIKRDYNGQIKTTCWKCNLLILWKKWKFW